MANIKFENSCVNINFFIIILHFSNISLLIEVRKYIKASIFAE